MTNTFDPQTVRYVFVLGTGRCGSTLVQEVLAQHPCSGFISNLDNDRRVPVTAGPLIARLYKSVPPNLMQKSRLRCIPSEAYEILNREVSPILSTPCRNITAEDVTPWLERRLLAFFERRAAAMAAPVFFHKFTGWPRAGFLQQVFPQARFIHVVRDGRAVANSWLQMPWWLGYQGPDHWQWGPLPATYASEWYESGKNFGLLAGLLWKLLIDAFETTRGRIPPEQWMDVRYEDIVARPKDIFASMLEFAGLPYDGFDSALDKYTFSQGRSDAFRRDLDAESLRLLDNSLAGHLGRFGYE